MHLVVVHDNFPFTNTAFLLLHLVSHRTAFERLLMHLHPLHSLHQTVMANILACRQTLCRVKHPTQVSEQHHAL